MCRKFRLNIFGVILALACASFSHAQTPNTESEWHIAHDRASKEYSDAKAGIWGGFILAGIGAPLTIYGASHQKECIQGGYVLSVGTVCDAYASKVDWRITGPGLGAIGAGIFAVIRSDQTRQKKGQRLKELDQIRQQHGWTIALKATSLSLAYRW